MYFKCIIYIVLSQVTYRRNAMHARDVGVSVTLSVNPLRPNSDLSETSHCNIKGLSVSAVMRIENMITQVKFY